MARTSRHDADTWDLATSVGATATMVAAARAIATNAESPAINDPFAEPLVRAVGVDFFTRWIAGDLSAADVDDPETGWGLSLMPDAMAARTRFFDTFLLDATAAGIRQVVILASGLDARAYRMAWPAGTVVFEIDQPEVLTFKASTMTGLGAQPSAEVRAVPIDLRQDWPAELRARGFDATRPTAWIAEGLFGYLPPEAQDTLLDHITTLSASGSRLGTEAVPNTSGVDLDQNREMLDRATAKWREQGFELEFGDLTYDGERNEVGPYLDRIGWTSVGTPLRGLLAGYGLQAIVENDDAVSMADTVYYASTLEARAA